MTTIEETLKDLKSTVNPAVEKTVTADAVKSPFRLGQEAEAVSNLPDGMMTFVTRAGQALQKKYDALGGKAVLGEIDRKEPVVWYFKNGSCICYDSKSNAAYEIHGEIYQAWLRLGGTKWGVPSTDETGTPDGAGRYNHFNGDTASIYWTADTGAKGIWGEIRNRWENLGWERSYLGYPTSDESDFADGGRANSFQNGGIYWWPDTGAIDLKGVAVQYTGLMCFGETDWDQGSSSDEPYFILAISTPGDVATQNTRIYDDVNGGDSRPDLLEVYRGVPYGINIGVVLMEHDFGDPNKYRDEVQKVVLGVHTAGTLALGLIPVVGPIIAAIAGPTLGSLMPALGDAINDAFDWGDDRIGSCVVTLGAKQMILLATQTGNSTYKGIGFKVETPPISGSGASYKAYFGLTPA